MRGGQLRQNKLGPLSRYAETGCNTESPTVSRSTRLEFNWIWDAIEVHRRLISGADVLFVLLALAFTADLLPVRVHWKIQAALYQYSVNSAERLRHNL